jgi:hypothetical protein
VEIKNEGLKLNFSDAMQSYALDLVIDINNDFSFHERVDYKDNRCRVPVGFLEGRID